MERPRLILTMDDIRYGITFDAARLMDIRGSSESAKSAEIIVLVHCGRARVLKNAVQPGGPSDDEFVALAQPLMDWLDANHHPHTQIVIDSGRAELLEGIRAHVRNETTHPLKD